MFCIGFGFFFLYNYLYLLANIFEVIQYTFLITLITYLVQTRGALPNPNDKSAYVVTVATLILLVH